VEAYRGRLPFDAAGNGRHIRIGLCDRRFARPIYEEDTEMAGLGRMGRGAIGFIAVLTLTGAGLAQAGRPVERKLLVGSFENIQVIGDIAVDVQTGKAPSAIASGDKRVLESLKLERIGTTLRVRLQDIVNNTQGVPITAPLLVRLTTQEIKDITVSGNGTLAVSEVRQQDLVRMLIAGNGSVSIGKLITDQLTATINGNGRIELGGGSIRDGRVTIDGAGGFEGAKAPMRNLRIEHIGNAVSTATVSEDSEIFNRGSGNITIGGKGKCFIKQAGAAAISCARIETGGSK
jgi:Putative auto-transporter adhesin, head GIN domain